MCGRVAQAKNPAEYGSMLKIDFTKGITNAPAHYNGAPGHRTTHPLTEQVERANARADEPRVTSFLPPRSSCST
jgi:hypothetical protein